MNFKYKFKLPRGLDKTAIEKISAIKGEPRWMREFRLKSLSAFLSKKMPNWGADLRQVDFDKVYYYLSPVEKNVSTWAKVPGEIRKSYEALGVPEAEKKFLGGLSAQFESQVVYENIAKKIKEKGVIFLDTDSALKKYPKLFKQYFSKLVPAGDNKFSALNSACWSGGSFIYVPQGVNVDLPLQAYFLINQKNAGQFERTLIIADEGSCVNYIEGCTAPKFTQSSLHAAVVEVFVRKNAHVRYTTVQNWNKNVYNLTTKRALVEENGFMEWIDANLGSKTTMKYPACILAGNSAKGEMLSIAYASSGQSLDTGAKMFHLAPKTTSRIVSKSISRDGGRNSFRSMVKVTPKAKNSRVSVRCDAMIFDSKSRTDTYPTMDVSCADTEVTHEASVERIGEEKLFYLMSRGLSKVEAETLVANGFLENIVKEISAEYAVEMNRLIQLEMEGKIA